MNRRNLVSVLAAASLAVAGLGVGVPAAQADHVPEADDCGGAYPVSVGAGTVHDPTGSSQYSYCSDGTLQELGVPATGDGGSDCGGEYPVTVEGDFTQIPDWPAPLTGYCSDGTINGVLGLLPDLPVSVEEDTTQCPNHTVHHPVGNTPLGYWTPAGATCVMELDGATQVSGSVTAYLGAVDANGDFTASVDLMIVDNDSGSVVASCSGTDTTPVEGFIPGLTQIASCSVSADADVDSVTVTATGLGIGTFRGSLS